MKHRYRALAAVLVLVAIACGGGGTARSDAGAPGDTVTVAADAALEVAIADAGTIDTPQVDADQPDAVGTDPGGGQDDGAVADDSGTDPAVEDAPAFEVVDDSGAADGDAPALTDILDANEAPLPVVVLNEIGCHHKDFLEIVVLSEGPADLAGWSLTDKPEDPTHRFVIPNGTVAGPGKYLVFFEEGSSGLPFGINCGTETVTLARPDGGIADSVKPPAFAKSRSWGRLPDGTGAFVENEPTPGGANQLPSDPMGSIFDPFQVTTVDLTLSDMAIKQLGIDPRSYVQATFSFTDSWGTTAPITVGVHLKGRLGSFRPLSGKAAFKVKFDHVENGQTFRGLKKMTLNNMVQDASMIHEALTYRLMRLLGVPAHRLGYAWVRVNGEDYGLYANIETYDKVSLGAIYESTAHLYEGGYGLDVEAGNEGTFQVDEGDNKDRTDLLALMAAVAVEDPAEWLYEVGKVADLDEMRRMWAAEVLVGHWDGYAPTMNNYYLHATDDGVFTMLPSGADQTWSSHLGYTSGKALMFQRCMRIAQCRQGFDAALGEALTIVDAFGFDAWAAELAAYLEPWVTKDPRRPYDDAKWAASVNATREFVVDRVAEVSEDYACILGPDADPDGDGSPCDEDCAPDDPDVSPFAVEICGDGIDQDCTGVADDGDACPCPAMMRGPHRYLFCQYARTWDQARARCQAQGADLVLVDGPGENQWLLDAMNALGGAQDVWLGVSDRDVEGVYLAWDGTIPAWGNYASGEPNDYGGTEDCIEMYAWGGWNDLPCKSKLAFVCEDVCTAGQDEDGDGAGRCGADCDDSSTALRPGADDVCGDGIDQDCDGLTDGALMCDAGCVTLAAGTTPLVACAKARTWDVGRKACAAALAGGDLAWFSDAAEQAAAVAALHAVLPATDVWIGLNDVAVEGVYAWPAGDVTTWTAWASGQPNNGSGGTPQHCVRMRADGKWNDTVCDSTYPILCRGL